MIDETSKTQIDKLGDRLRDGKYGEADLELLDKFRRGFRNSYEVVVDRIRSQTQEQPTGRPAKSTPSIVDKLNRESIRLSQIQDIAGCRIIVSERGAQNIVVRALNLLFPGSTVTDRRSSPSHGYRAVHIIAHIEGLPIEIQIRTALQHLWAELSEKLADISDPILKYGRGDPDLLLLLSQLSELVARDESVLERLYDVKKLLGDLKGADLSSVHDASNGLRQVELTLVETEREAIGARADLERMLTQMISAAAKGEK